MFNFYGRYPEGFIKDGAAVICRGRIDVYEKRGEYRLLVDELEVRGLGLLQVQFQVLKEKLFKEGLFDSSRKASSALAPHEDRHNHLTRRGGNSGHAEDDIPEI